MFETFSTVFKHYFDDLYEWPSFTGGNHGGGCGRASQEKTLGKGVAEPHKRKLWGRVWSSLTGENHRGGVWSSITGGNIGGRVWPRLTGGNNGGWLCLSFTRGDIGGWVRPSLT